MEGIEAVCFDAFGTLLHIVERRRPFETLFVRLGVEIHEAARLAMTTDAGLPDLAARLGDARSAEGLVAELDAELATIALFEETTAALAMLREARVRTWVVSNLAAPYGPPLRRLLEGWVDGYSLSFEVGATKPDPAIFAHACRGLSLDPGQVLMAGDSLRSDVEGAESFGMRAVWLRRGCAGEWPRSVSSLRELTERLVKRCG